ncbi:MAG TPA: glucose-6-phosphate dehydrogenase [Verrucomicrobiales bacterium]|nr:glucose-6-phosphate dehydrogenase [Verrucomicrobiales bacterium]
MEAINPFSEDLSTRSRPEACTVVIFGASGDLTGRKLIPALYNIAADGDLPPTLKVVGFARREKTNESFRSELETLNRKFSRQGHNDRLWSTFSQNIFYHRSEFEDKEGYQRLATLLDELDAQGAGGNRLFYLSTAPEYFQVVLKQLAAVGLNNPKPGKWSRVVIEKPFGTDLATAQALNTAANETFQEADTYRIDHYLGKETAQNIMVLRFANAIFEPVWNSRYIDHVQISCAENLGMEGGRGGYYDKAGCLRDMVQNHLLQLVMLVAMEPPADLSADGIRDEKVKVLKNLRSFKDAADVAENVVRAQYTAGTVGGKAAPGYRQEDRIAPDSMTEAYVALRINIDNWRWEGVPFYLRMGKQLPKKATEISVHFKRPPHVLFNRGTSDDPANVLVIRIQPDEGISLRVQSKIPGPSVRTERVKMDFHYANSFGKASPEAYERLLLDAMAGDATLFARRDEVEQAWRYIDQIENAWHNSPNPPPMYEYPAGSWGPAESDKMLEADGRNWRRL